VLAATVIAANYLPHAQVLADSLHRWHPEARLAVLVVDGSEPDRLDGVDVLTPRDVGMDSAELHRRALLYDAQGVISSLRWWLLRHLLEEAQPVVLLDADMLVLGNIEDLWTSVPHAGVLLSPHALAPLAGEPGAWPEEELLRSGTFSGGLVGVGSAAGPFLDWVCERTARDCLRAPERGLLYGQTWLNLVPALFEHHILRDAGVNTQVHVMAGEDVAISDAGVRLGETPVRLFHFTGFDPAAPERLSRYYPGTQLGERPGLARLCREYAEALRAAGWPVASPWPWGVLPAGVPVDEAMRAVYRAALLGGADEPPDPFDASDPGAFCAWLCTPPASHIPRYLLALHRARGDLQAAFPGVPGDDEAAYLAWAARKVAEPGQRELAAQLVPGASSAPT
jgi:hypothetical protein